MCPTNLRGTLTNRTGPPPIVGLRNCKDDLSGYAGGPVRVMGGRVKLNWWDVLQTVKRLREE